MTDPPLSQLDPRKFQDPFITAKGERGPGEPQIAQPPALREVLRPRRWFLQPRVRPQIRPADSGQGQRRGLF